MGIVAEESQWPWPDRCVVAALRTIVPRRSTAAVSSVLLLARITPWLPASDSGLTTHGNRAAEACCSVFSSKPHRRKLGCGTPARASSSRIQCLLRAAEAASSGVDGSQAAVLTAAECG